MRICELVLITNSGKRIVVKYPERVESDVVDDLLSHMQERQNWSVGDYDETTAFQGQHQLFILNMNSIIGVGK